MEFDPDLDELEPLQPITQRLEGLRPSKELLEFYRRKVADYESEHNELLAKLDKYKASFEDKHKQQWELAQRESEIQQLQQSLSDMQMYLFQEREHVLRLYAENDRLKIQEIEDRKKIQRLISMGEGVEAETTYFKDPAGARIVKPNEKVRQTLEEERKLKTSKAERERTQNERLRAQVEDAHAQNESLTLTIEALKAQLEDQTRTSKEQIAALLEDRRVRQEESKTKAKRDQETISALSEKLRHTQELLYDSTRDFLELKYTHGQVLKESEEEKERLLHRIEELKDDIDMYQAQAAAALRKKAMQISRGPAKDDKQYHDMGTNAYRAGGRGRGSSPNRSERRSHSAGLGGQEDVHEDANTSGISEYDRHQELVRDTLAEMYREQCIQLEDELCRLKEQQEAAKEHESAKSKTASQRAKMWKQRYENLERRRVLEVEGYKTDISQLRKKLKDMEQQLYKLAVHMGGGPPQAEKMARDIKRSAARSKKLIGELQQLKGQVYGMERQVRHLNDI